MTGLRIGAGRFLAVALLALAACVGPGMAGAGDAAQALAGTEWTLQELNGRAVAATGGAVPTLSFGAADGRASGNGGCNQFSGTYTQEGASLHFGPLVSTRRACVDEAGNAQETAYLRALESVTRYSATAELLILYAGDQPVARLGRNLS
jgi:heat shock protein HslJ